MVAESRSLLRGMLDATFAEVALSKHDDLYEKFIEDDMLQRLNYINSFRALSKKVKKHHRIGNKALLNMAEDLNREIEKRGIKPITSQFLAYKAGMLDHYNTLYVLLSSSTHSKVRDLEEYFEGGDITSENLRWGPDVNGLDTILLPACELLFISSRFATELFEIEGYNEGFQKQWEIFEELRELSE